MASSIANGVLSKSAALAALTIGSGENSDDAVGLVRVLTLRVEVDDGVGGTLNVLSVAERLDFDAVRRILGVSKDSRAFGSSNLVYLPMEGRWMT